MSKRYMVGKRSLTGNKRIWPKGKEVSAKLLDLTDEQFKAMVKKGSIVPYATSAVKATPAPPPPVDPPTPVLRADRVEAAIKSLFQEDGTTRKSKDDFTQDDKPTTDALNHIFEPIEGEDDISAAERDEAWDKYLAKQTDPDAG